jgi:hypothetical protein
MQKKLMFPLMALALALLVAFSMYAQQKNAATPVAAKTPLVLNTFTVKPDVAWPYDTKQLQTLTVAELKGKLANRFDVSAERPAQAAHLYTVDGEIVGWRAGNAAKRVLIGMGSGREAADIHYWVTDETGKKIFEHNDTIRAEFWSSNFAGSVGQLAHPFADKIAHRISDAKLK